MTNFRTVYESVELICILWASVTVAASISLTRPQYSGLSIRWIKMGLRDDLELEANWDRLQQLYPAVTVGVPSLLCLVVAVYILIENGKSATHAKHWEDICLRVFMYSSTSQLVDGS